MHEGAVDAVAHFVYAGRVVEQCLLVGGGDESQFYEAAGHGRLSQHEESGLFHSLVRTVGCRAHVALHHLGQFHTLGHVLVLHELEHDVALR